MRDVMAGASLTPGGFYRHFRSKDRLIAEASSAALDRAFAMLVARNRGQIARLRRSRELFLSTWGSRKSPRSPIFALSL